MSTKITDHMLKGTSTRTLLQRAAAEAGFNLVDGSFEEGAVVTDPDDVVWCQADGKYYSWGGALPTAVAGGSTPATAGGIGVGSWSDKTDLMLRSDINIVQKRFACVADMVADASLTIGKIAETVGYYNGWAATVDAPKGGNRYEVVASGTGVADGGTFITLSNGLQAKGLFDDGIYTPYHFGAKANGVFNDTQALINTIATGHDIDWLSGQYVISDTITGNGGAWLGTGSGNSYDSTYSKGDTQILLSGTNSDNAFIIPPKIFKGFHVYGQTRDNIGVQLGTPAGFVGFHNWEDIIIRGCDIGLDGYNWYSSTLTNIVIQGNNRGIRITPPDTVGVDDGYFTSTTWLNVHIADNTVYGVNVNVPLGTKTWAWDNVVIERNGSLGSYQGFFNNVTLVGIGVYFEGSSSVPAIKSSASKFNFKRLYMGGTGGIDASASNIELVVDGFSLTSSTDLLSNFSGASTVLNLKNGNLYADPRGISNKSNVTLDNVYVSAIAATISNTVPKLTIGNDTVSSIRPTAITYTVSYAKAITSTIAAGATTTVITNQYHYSILRPNTTAFVTIMGYYPGLIATITPATTGSTDYFCLTLTNTTATNISLSSVTITMTFMKVDVIQL